jgi:DNA invertase Pin-like site-specific DNA recombinase
MKAALYARVSKDEETSDSVAVQLRACREFAQQRRLTIVAEYEDDGISGWSTGNRPGFQALMHAARRGDFDIIVFRDVERLARGPDLPVVCRQLEFYRCALLGLDKSDSADASFRMRIGLSAIMSAEMIEKGRVLTRGALQDRAKAGHSTGGAAYGYRSAPVDGANPDGRKHLVIEEEEARVVVRICEMYADGTSPRSIAARLNAEGIPSPGARWKRVKRRADGKWLASAIHGHVERGSGILNNTRYIGLVTYGRRQFVKNPASGVRVARAGEEARIEFRDERLRIVSDALWQRVKARQARTKASQPAMTVRGTSVRKGGGGKPGKYLFTGVLACDVCGASFVLRNRESYSCATHWHGGACANTINVARSVVQEVILDGIREDLADPVVVDEFERRFHAAMRNSRQAQADPGKRIAQLEREVANVANAIANGLLSDTLAQKLRTAEEELTRLRARRCGTPPALIVPNVRRRFLEMVNGLDQVLMLDPERGRETLRGILDDKIRLRPDTSGRFLWAEYSLGMSALLPRQTNADIVVAGARYVNYRLSLAA